MCCRPNEMELFKTSICSGCISAHLHSVASADTVCNFITATGNGVGTAYVCCLESV